MCWAAYIVDYHRRILQGIPVAERRDCAPAQPNGFPMRYFFHVKDGTEMLDENGVEFADMNAIKQEAVQAAAELLGGLHGRHFWSGEPWKLWVTDQANGAGKTLLTLVFSAELSDDSSLVPGGALAARPV